MDGVTNESWETKTKEKGKETGVTDAQAAGKMSAVTVTDGETDRQERAAGAKPAFSFR